jgi:RimJ/RimL family protein N-acetyltransferase
MTPLPIAAGRFTGLDPVNDGLPSTGVEAGWRLARSAWGHGYASEAGLAVLDYGFVTVAYPRSSRSPRRPICDRRQ